MIGGTILALLLGAAMLAFVVAPLMRKDAAEGEERSATLGRARELEARRQQLLASLKDLEDDRATDKIDEADFEELNARLSADAIDVMRELDIVEKEREAAARAARKAAQPLKHPGSRRSRRR
jgi:hypothetical protein